MKITATNYYKSPSFGQKRAKRETASQHHELRLRTEDDGYKFLSYEIKKPQKITDDLKQAKKIFNQGIDDSFFDTTIKYIQTTGKYKDEKLRGISGIGLFSIAFDIGDNRILKVSKTNPFEFRQHNPNFDIPLLSKVEEFDGKFIFLQAKADIKHSSFIDVLKVKRKMKKEGYMSTMDFDITRCDQVGRYNGKSYLIDTRCAIPKNNLFTKIVLRFREIVDRRYSKKQDRMNNYDFVLFHEKPVANLTKKEGLKIIGKAIRSRI